MVMLDKPEPLNALELILPEQDIVTDYRLVQFSKSEEEIPETEDGIVIYVNPDFEKA